MARRDREGVVINLIGTTSDLVEKMVTHGVGFLDDVRSSANDGTGRALDWIETEQRTMMDLARKWQGRIDDMSTRSLRSSQRVLLDVVQRLRNTGERANGFANDPVSASVDKSEDRDKHAAA